MTGIPYRDDEPLRCATCGQLPAVLLTDRDPGPHCARHLPWRPSLPSWGVGRCARCGGPGVRFISRRGRVSVPLCLVHAPAPEPFDRLGDDVLAATAADAPRGWRR